MEPLRDVSVAFAVAACCVIYRMNCVGRAGFLFLFLSYSFYELNIRGIGTYSMCRFRGGRWDMRRKLGVNLDGNSAATGCDIDGYTLLNGAPLPAMDS